MTSSKTSTATKNKISVSLTDEAASAVEELAERTGLGVSEIIRRAIALEQFIVNEIDQGSEFLVRRDGESLTALLKRLNKAVAHYYSDTVVTDETEAQV